MIRRYLTVTAMAFTALTTTLGAQPIEIACAGTLKVMGDACYATIAEADSLQTQAIHIQVLRDGVGLDSVKVRFRATGGTLLPESTTTDKAGNARAMWVRHKGADAVAIAAVVEKGGYSSVRHIRLDLLPQPRPELVISTADGYDQSWFENTQLRRPVDIKIKVQTPLGLADITDPAVCGAQRVAFAKYGGTGAVTPDTGIAEIFPNGDGTNGCYAWTNWTLGAGAGVRDLRATLLPAPGYVTKSPPQQIEATARSLPRLIIGGGFARDKGYFGLRKGSQTTIKVERLLADGSKLIYDSTVTSAAAVDEIKSAYNLLVMAGVNIALPIPSDGILGRLSLTAGADLKTRGDDFFAGLSLPRLADVSLEAFPVDVHLVAHFGRDEVLRNVEACRAGTSCSTKRRTRYQGLGVLVSADATALLGEVLKKLVP